MTNEQRASLFGGPLDTLAYFLERLFIENKFMGLFSFLFGISFWLFLNRGRSRGDSPTTLFYRRIFWLFAIGAIHGWLLWCFDILRFYALWAVLLPLLRTDCTQPPATRRDDHRGSAAGARCRSRRLADQAGRRRPRRDGARGVLRRKLPRSPGGQLAVRLVSDEFHLSDWLSSGHPWASSARTLRCKNARPRKPRRLSHATSRGSSSERAAGLVGNTIFAGGLLSSTHSPSLAFVRRFLVEGGQLGLTLVYASALALGFLVVRWRRVICLLAPIGQMALTWYLFQTAFGIWMFYGFAPGPALMGRVGPASLVAVSVVGFGAQVAFARAWMRRFRFGPAEWCWRSLRT